MKIAFNVVKFAEVGVDSTLLEYSLLVASFMKFSCFMFFCSCCLSLSELSEGWTLLQNSVQF